MILEILLLILTLLILRYYLTKQKGLPPGPLGYPFIGSGLLMNIPQVKEYQKKYGDIFRTEVTGVNMVYICDFKLIKEAMSKHEFADRPDYEGFHFLTDGKPSGVILTNGQKWTNSRRFLLRNLRDLGMGKSSLDEAIITEAKHLVEDFKKISGKPTDFPESLNIAVLNIVWQMVASFRYDLYDKEVTDFIRIMKSLQDDTAQFVILEFCPILKKVLPQFLLDKVFRADTVRKTADAAKKLFGNVLTKRMAKLDPSHAENVIDQYLIQMKDKTDVAEFFDENDLMRTIFDLFAAGFDTVSNTLRWIILYSAKYPHIQERIQKQIDQVISQGEFPGHHHKADLPLVEAFIHEVLRCSSLIPLSVMHGTSNDTHFNNYLIPKGTIVFGVTGYCHQDERYWDEPQTFNIDRFLDNNGRFISHKDGFAPFGTGKRSCLGESLARMELSIFTTSLLKNFTFSPPEGKDIDLTPANVPLSNFYRKQDFIMTIRN